MSKISQPELKRFVEKRVSVNVQGGRKVKGTLRGYDIFLNLVLDDAVEMVHPRDASEQGENRNVWQDGAGIGMVVSEMCVAERE